MVGGQVGHKGNYRAKMDADEVIKVELSHTCECGGEVAICEKPYIHQKVDLPGGGNGDVVEVMVAVVMVIGGNVTVSMVMWW